MKLFSNEIVFRGHPDKVCDQIGDALLDEMLKQDPNTRAGIEVTGGKGIVFLTGEVTTKAKIDVGGVVKNILKDVGYKNLNMQIINNIGLQSPDIALGVDTGGAGDQGMMFGYACNDNDKMLPNAMVMLQDISREYRKLNKQHYDVFLPDGKAMLTGLYEGRKLREVKSVLVSYQVEEDKRKGLCTDDTIRQMVKSVLGEYGYSIEDENIMINPTGKFEIGGFEGDAGVLGRKIVVDTYHGFYHTGGGALSGKDGTKVDRSGTYKSRQIAKRYLKKYDLEWCEVQISYAIGVAEPVSIMINSDKGQLPIDMSLYGECKPNNVIKDLDLQSPNYSKTSMYGHFGGDNIWEYDI